VPRCFRLKAQPPHQINAPDHDDGSPAMYLILLGVTSPLRWPLLLKSAIAVPIVQSPTASSGRCLASRTTVRPHRAAGRRRVGCGCGDGSAIMGSAAIAEGAAAGHLSRMHPPVRHCRDGEGVTRLKGRLRPRRRRCRRWHPLPAAGVRAAGAAPQRRPKSEVKSDGDCQFPAVRESTRSKSGSIGSARR
jgi:hypothetical protein